jgi:hypothetical protein
MTGRTEGRQADPPDDTPAVKCPQCGSLNLASILHGEPSANAALEADIRAGRIVLGGCVVDDDEPRHRCRDCGSQFGGTTDRPAAEARRRESLATRLLPAAPRPGAWRVGRLVLTGAAQSEEHPPDRRVLLAAAFDELVRQNVTVRYLVTPAGFFEPKARPELDPTHGWDTTPGDFELLRQVAEATVAEELDADTLGRARGHAAYLVIGADVRVPGRGVYAETALVYGVKEAQFVGATGKTYPTVGKQERRLVRNPDAAGHVLDVDGEQVAVLVCHDLNAWSPRGTASRGRRRAKVAAELDSALVDGHPTIVLHLPHKTHSAQTWAQSWARLEERLAPATTWTSAIRYRKGHSRPPVSLGSELLDRTRSGSREVLDIVLGDHTSLGSP